MRDPPCFGFYAADLAPACRACKANRRCKAVLQTDGFDILADIVDHLATNLPPGLYEESPRISEIVRQLRTPPSTPRLEEQTSLGASDNEKLPEDLEIG
jgi:hypothetical protein